MAEKRRCNRLMRVSDQTLEKAKKAAKLLGLSTPNDVLNLLCDRVIREHKKEKETEKNTEKN